MLKGLVRHCAHLRILNSGLEYLLLSVGAVNVSVNAEESGEDAQDGKTNTDVERVAKAIGERGGSSVRAE